MFSALHLFQIPLAELQFIPKLLDLKIQN